MSLSNLHWRFTTLNWSLKARKKVTYGSLHEVTTWRTRQKQSSSGLWLYRDVYLAGRGTEKHFPTALSAKVEPAAKPLPKLLENSVLCIASLLTLISFPTRFLSRFLETTQKKPSKTIQVPNSWGPRSEIHVSDPTTFTKNLLDIYSVVNIPAPLIQKGLYIHQSWGIDSC